LSFVFAREAPTGTKSFETLEVYRVGDTLYEVEKIKPLIGELASRLNAYLRSIGPAVATTNDKGPMTKDKP